MNTRNQKPIIKPNPDEPELGGRRLRFAELILRGNTETSAYRKAGYSARGGSVHSAASRLLRNVKVGKYLASRRRELSSTIQAETLITLRQVVLQLHCIGFANITDFVTFGPKGLRLKDMKTVPEHKLCAIKRLRNSKNGISLTLHDKVTALCKLLDLLGPNEVG